MPRLCTTTTNNQRTTNNHQQNIIITQGFIGSTDANESTTLGREGSDYSAAIFANILNAESLTIWKDVEGVMSADPNAQVWIDTGTPPKIDLRRFGSVPFGIKQRCMTYGLSLSPLALEVYSATEANRVNLGMMLQRSGQGPARAGRSGGRDPAALRALREAALAGRGDL